jgi:hypothetical protein
MCIAPACQRLTLDVLHRQVRQTRGINPCVVETRDERVLEARQDVALSGKALLEIGSQVRQHRQLQRHLALEGAVGTPGEPDLGHAPGA